MHAYWDVLGLDDHRQRLFLVHSDMQTLHVKTTGSTSACTAMRGVAVGTIEERCTLRMDSKTKCRPGLMRERDGALSATDEVTSRKLSYVVLLDELSTL